MLRVFLYLTLLKSLITENDCFHLQVPTTSNLNRSKSLGALSLMSANTLPIYISDAVRKRCIAVK